MNRRSPRLATTDSALKAATARETATQARRGLLAPDEGARTRLIGELSSLLHEPAIPESTRSAGLELIGWLARRMPGEVPHALGVEEALQAKRVSTRKGR